MSKEVKYLFCLLRLVLVIIVLIMIISCDLTKEQYFGIKELDYAEERSDLVIVREYRESTLFREMFSDYVERFHDEKKTISYNVELIDYHKDGSVIMTLEADTLFIDEMVNSYTAKGDVTVVREEGTLMTEHLIWYEDKDEIYSPVEATIIRGENILRGYELITNTDFSTLTIQRVTAEGVVGEEDIDW